ncbi:MAG: MFS transporter, partial [Acidimicrobiia bacterium]|nr:MFS transporter [Acidimicrobiia bacterium]
MWTRPVVALGWLTISAYGAWFYGFGALLDDIVASTGWSETGVVAVASGAALLAGAGSIGVGQLLDRLGSRGVFLSGIVGSLLLLGAANAPSLGAFALFGVLGGGILGAAGHYHATLSTAAALDPTEASRSIARVTLIGAFSSTLFLPLAGWLTDWQGWRVSLAVLALLAASGFVWAAVSAASPRRSFEGPPARIRWSRLAVVAIAASFLGAAGYGTVSTYQVAVMVSLGLSLPLAASLGGLRGVAQFLGRLPIDRVVARFGSRRALVGANLLIGVGAALLWWSGSPVVAGAFALVTGIGIGAFSPLAGILAVDAVGTHRVGSLMGMQ